MRTITLNVTELSSVLESNIYVNKKGEEKKIMKNVIYFFFTEGIEFNCKLYVDDAEELGFLEINGEQPNKGIECLYSLEFIFENELKNFYEVLMSKYNFLPSYREHDGQLLFISPSIEYNKENFQDILMTEDSIFLLGLTKEGSELIDKEEYFDEHFYNKVQQIKISEIKDIDIVVLKEDLFVDIYFNDSVIKIESEHINRDEIKNIIDLKRTIKLTHIK